MSFEIRELLIQGYSDMIGHQAPEIDRLDGRVVVDVSVTEDADGLGLPEASTGVGVGCG